MRHGQEEQLHPLDIFDTTAFADDLPDSRTGCLWEAPIRASAEADGIRYEKLSLAARLVWTAYTPSRNSRTRMDALTFPYIPAFNSCHATIIVPIRPRSPSSTAPEIQVGLLRSALRGICT